MLQSVKRANDLTEIIKAVGWRWSHSIAKQKGERITSLIKAKTRQIDRQETYDFTEALKVRRNIQAIDKSINSLDTSYSKLFNNFKNFKSK